MTRRTRYCTGWLGRWSLGASVMAGVLLVAAACAPAAAPASAPAPGPAASTPAATRAPVPPTAVAPPTAVPAASGKPSVEQPRYGGTLISAVPQDPPTIDPEQEATVFALAPIASAYDSLVQIDPLQLPAKRVVVGDLATKWDVTGDGQTWTFTLVPKAEWHDGKPLTSADVKFSIERMRDRPGKIKSPLASLWAFVSDVTTPDTRTVVVTTKVPLAYFLTLIATPMASIVPQHVVEANPNALQTKALGSGPFSFVSWERGVSIELKRNPNYFVQGRPYLDGTKWLIMKDLATRIAAFRTGRINFSGIAETVPPRDQDSIQQTMPGVQITHYMSGGAAHIFLNVKQKPFDDIRVRRAVFKALDQKQVIKVAEQGAAFTGAYLLGDWAPPSSLLQTMTPIQGPSNQDIADAKNLLTQAGFPNGLSAEYLYPTFGQSKQRALIAQEQMKRIGIDLTLRVGGDVAPTKAMAAEGRYQMTELETTGGLIDPSALLTWYVTGDPGNYSQLSDETLDGLFAKIGKTIDPVERKHLTDQFQQRLWELAPSFPTRWSSFDQMVAPSVHNYNGHGIMRDNFRYRDIWIAP